MSVNNCNRNIAAILLLAFFTLASGVSRAQAPKKTTEEQKYSEKIIRAVEDTIGIDIKQLGSGDLIRAKEKALELQGVDLEEDFNSGRGTEVEGNIRSNQLDNKKLIEDVTEAAEKVEKLVETASEELREKAEKVDIFGFDYVQEREVKLFNSALDVKPPDNYIIGAGDEINVNIWGYSDYNEVFIVEKEGYIQPRFVGRVYIKGLKVDEARKVLVSKFERIYDLRNSKFEIAINYSRVITVNVVGEVLNPGSYTLPAINSAFNILAFVGGPSSLGSLRNIMIKRNGEVIDRFDLYSYLFDPESNNEIFLQNNDYIFVPLSQKVVEIRGDIKRQGKYELLEEETFADLVRYAAGFNPTAYTKSVQVRRYQNNEAVIFDVNIDSLQAAGGKLGLKNGDVITIRKIDDIVENFVKIKGPVYFPGQYEFRKEMRITDLVEEAGGFKEDIYTKEAYLTRVNDDKTRTTRKLDLLSIIENPGGETDILLQRKDELEFFSSTYFYDPYGVAIYGAVRNPRSFKIQKGMTIRDLILMAGGLEKFAHLDRAYITRKNRTDNSIDYYAFKVDTANNMAALDQYLVQEDDHVTILSNLDFVKESTVTIKGGVKNPGKFELWKDLSLKDLILISGGLRESAFLERAYIYRTYDNLDEEIIPVRLDTANNMAALAGVELRRKDVVEIFSKNNYTESYPIQVDGYVRDPGVFKYRQNMSLSDALLLAGGFKFAASNHRVEIARITNFAESVANDLPLKIEIISLDLSIDLTDDPVANSFILEPFDQIFIRETPGFDFQERVYLSGEVLYPGTYVLKSKDERISSVIDRAGGLTPYAFTSGAKLERKHRDIGNVLMDLERAMRRPKSKFNYILKEGDNIDIPRREELVTITGKIAYPYIDADSTVNVAYTANKRARYYIRNYGTGFTKQSRKKDTYVVHAGGLVKETKSFFGVKFYPKVTEGATVHVPEKQPKKKRRDMPRAERNIDPLNLVQGFFATATSGITLYLLVDRALE